MNIVYDLLFKLGLILLITNFSRALFIRLRIPFVVANILIGVLFGPTLLNYVVKDHIIEWIAQVGILILIFEAGITTNVKKIFEDSKKASFPAIGGIVIPFLFGFWLSRLFSYDLYASMVVGSIFTATSISISLITLIDVNKLNSIEGRCIINSAIIDDVLGIILVSLIFGLSAGQTGVQTSIFQSDAFLALIKIVLFFTIAILVGIHIVPRVFSSTGKFHLHHSIASFSLAVIFVYSWFAEYLGMAAITGAYLAGLFLGQTEFKNTLNSDLSLFGKSLFIDIFFVSIGLGLNLNNLTIKPVYLVLFVLLAILGKIFGCGLGAKLSHFDNIRSIRIGVGMVPRGEIALIIAAMGLSKNMIGNDLMSATVVMVVVTSLISPFLIKYSYTVLKKKSFRNE